MPISEAIVSERHAIFQRRAMLRSSLTVWDENHTAEG